MSNPLTPEILAALEYVGDGLTLEIAGHLWRKNRSELLRLARVGLAAETPLPSPALVETRCCDCRHHGDPVLGCAVLYSDPEVTAWNRQAGAEGVGFGPVTVCSTACPGFATKETA